MLDNIFDEELQACVSEHLDVLMGEDPAAAQESVGLLAQNIAERASLYGGRKGDPTLATPFAQAAKKVGWEYQGGKMDDVAVVCGVVRKGARPRQRLEHNFPPETVQDSQAAPYHVHGNVVPVTATAPADMALIEEAAAKAAWLAKIDAPSSNAAAAPQAQASQIDEETAKAAWLAKLDVPTWSQGAQYR